MSVRSLPRPDEDFPAWYGDVVRRADLAENGLVRGTMVIKPYGYAIWEAVQRALDDRIKATGHQNLYFPLLVPASVMAREAEMLEGFSPELAVVTQAGGRELEEPLVLRPTSEAVAWTTYARWIQSYRDLPLRYNQWANAVRWELRPRLFLRTSEFLWQEGHTAHATEAEAQAEARLILDEVYADTAEQVLAMPVLRGRKSASERFPGAVDTLTVEALMRDGKALQAATSHDLGQGFAEAYGVRFTDRDGTERAPYATSWGSSTRLVGGLVMAHGDAAGLRLPPAVAPYQVVVVPIGDVAEDARAAAARLREAGLRVELDDREEQRPGWKFNHWELRGVPLRLELGPRDLAAGAGIVVRRDTGERESVPLEGLAGRVGELLADVQAALFADASAFRVAHTIRPATRAEMVEFLAAAGGFAVTPWCGSETCEAEIKAETRATIRILSLDGEQPDGPCVACGGEAVDVATWAQSY
jgi:prolyl-tRNA synthetase